MGTLSNYAMNELLDHISGTAYTPVATLYIGYTTDIPVASQTGATINEIANANNYSRKAITFGAAASRRVTQNAVVTYDQATGTQGTASGWAILDSVTHGAGNMLAFGDITNDPTIVNLNTPSIADTSVWIEFTASTDISDYAANAALDLMFRNQTFTISSTYVGLTTATIATSDTGTSVTEVSGGSYARVLINAALGASPAWSAAASQSVDNANAFSFIESTASWGTATSVFVADAATLGNLLFFDNDMADQAVSDASVVTFNANGLTFNMS